MRTLSREVEQLLEWPEFLAGYKQMTEIVVQKEAAGDFSVTTYRIELTPPHQSRRQSSITLTHDPKNNCTFLGVNAGGTKVSQRRANWLWPIGVCLLAIFLSRGC